MPVTTDWLRKTSTQAGPLNSTMKDAGMPMPDLSLSTIHDRTTFSSRKIPDEKVIYLTELKAKDKEFYARIVTDLGGRVDVDGNGGATHLVTPTITRGVKVIKAIARGLWVLSPEYLIKSRDAGRFLDESPYEHGQMEKIKYDSDDSRKLAGVCKHWRLEVQHSPKYAHGAFAGWNALVCGGLMAEAVVELIRFGGGNAKIHHNAGTDFAGFTHALFESKKNLFYEKNAVRLKEMGIPVRRVDYTIDSLLQKQPKCDSKLSKVGFSIGATTTENILSTDYSRQRPSTVDVQCPQAIDVHHHPAIDVQHHPTIDVRL
uniref:BRCT domain-containing protein n=1 Tax=Steinernema glaseri TaxID=37863 RepID=A0A1I7YTC5_9BILA